jgi:hypothetical protein
MDNNIPDTYAASRAGILDPSSALRNPFHMSFGSIDADTGAEPPSVVNATPSFASATARPPTSVERSTFGAVNPSQDETHAAMQYEFGGGDWTTVTRRTSRTHRERSMSSRNQSVTDSASESDRESTIAHVRKMSRDKIMAVSRYSGQCGCPG